MGARGRPFTMQDMEHFALWKTISNGGLKQRQFSMRKHEVQLAQLGEFCRVYVFHLTYGKGGLRPPILLQLATFHPFYTASDA